jgi:uncharacterized GH25 family protein
MSVMRKSSSLLVTRAAAPLLLAAWASAPAHEFWVEPSAFNPASGERLDIRLCVGDGFEGWPLARNDQWIERFAAIGRSGEQALLGLDGADPAGIVRLQAPGGYIVAFESKHSLAQMAAEEFAAYLKEMGLEQILALRERRGESQRAARDAYTRHAKALVRVGESQEALVDRAIGLRLELIAEIERDVRTFQLLYDGKPLVGALVAATRLGAADSDLHVRTDKHGRATFDLQAAGAWRISAVHMIEARGRVDADWESLWASLTFESAAPEALASRRVCRNRAQWR